jgi:adenylate cyclase
MRVRTQLALALAALAGFTAALLVAINYFSARDILFRQIQSEVLSIASTAASQMDAAAFERVRQPGDENDPDYHAIQTKLRAIRDANRRDDVYTRFLYTMRPTTDGKWIYVVDAEEPGDDFSPFGSEVESNPAEPLHLDRPYAEKAFSHDSFGSWLSANAPIRDAAGRPVALVGVDLVASEVEARLHGLLVAGITAGSIALIAAVAAGLLIARWFTAPLERIGAVVRRIGTGEFDATVKMDRRDEFGELATAVNHMGVALRERDALKGALVRYVSREVAEEVLAGKSGVLKGTRKQITVLIVDIRNFTAISAQLEPEVVLEFLNKFFTRMIEIIFEHRGTLDKFLGDGCLAIFGAPLEDPDHPRSAVCVARAMLAACDELGGGLRERGIELRIGIGLHTGEAIVGDIGSDQRTEYTAIGDTVNVASRLESLNKEYGTQLLASEAVVRGAGDEFTFREIAEVAPRGVARPMKIYTLSD